jgi:hypothetical protein
MNIKVVKTEQISDGTERWLVTLPEKNFRDFGFLLEALEGVGIHRKSREGENLMEVDVAVGMRDELTALLHDLKDFN